MSLDIGIGDGSSLVPERDEPSLFLEDDGYYWFLHPLFEGLQAETGQYIDSRRRDFSRGSLAALERCSWAEHDSVAAGYGEVHVGTQIMPG